MRNRDYKTFVAGELFHIYNRGNNKEKIFWDDQDYKAFLLRLGLSLGFKEKELDHPLFLLPYSRIRITNTHLGDFKLHAFCLMPNHFHMLLEQCSNVKISKLLLKICTSFSMFVNKKYRRVGHVFQDCFKAVHIESNSQLMWASNYIHMNPVKDRLVKTPDQYKWSSYNDYVSERGLPIINTEFLLSTFDGKTNFKEQNSIQSLMSRGTLDIGG